MLTKSQIERASELLAEGKSDAEIARDVRALKADVIHWRANVRKPLDAITRTATHDDGKFVRTALVLDGSETGGSVDVVDRQGRRLCRINLSYQPEAEAGEELLTVDVIDVDKRYTKLRRALVFSPTRREHIDVPEGGNLVGVHFVKAR